MASSSARPPSPTRRPPSSTTSTAKSATTGIEFGGAAILPHDPTETPVKEYGDCKDKATLLVTMLRAAGIPAYVAPAQRRLAQWTSPLICPAWASSITLSSTFPARHRLARASPAGPDLWIEATDQYARLGQLPLPTRPAWRSSRGHESKSLTRTPEFSSKDNTLLEFREIKLSENGPATVLEKTQPHGVYESRYRSFYADRPDKDTRENLTNYVKSQYVAEKLTSVDRTDPGDLSKQFELTIACEKAKRGYTGLTDAQAAIRYEALFFRLPEDLTRKKTPRKRRTRIRSTPRRPAPWIGNSLSPTPST